MQSIMLLTTIIHNDCCFFIAESCAIFFQNMQNRETKVGVRMAPSLMLVFD